MAGYLYGIVYALGCCRCRASGTTVGNVGTENIRRCRSGYDVHIVRRRSDIGTGIKFSRKPVDNGPISFQQLLPVMQAEFSGYGEHGLAAAPWKPGYGKLVSHS